MSFAKKEYEFLSEIGLSSRNPGCYVSGTWKGSGPVISSFNPAENQGGVDGIKSYCSHGTIHGAVHMLPFMSFGLYSHYSKSQGNGGAEETSRKEIDCHEIFLMDIDN
ncbi:hypothetical protein L1049_004922 [Liquidambar formosana]|uniref:Uncharacterized protein n=1 Tax=Liquidambar formosana TaxID=63359 RepID=A0AAP0WYN2_LIQFO